MPSPGRGARQHLFQEVKPPKFCSEALLVDVVEATVLIEEAEGRGVHWHNWLVNRLYFYS